MNKSVFKFIWIVGFLASFAMMGTFVSPKQAFASCDPDPNNQTAVPPADPVIQSVGQPTGTYDNPGILPISISGTTSFFCSGENPNGGGYGFGNIDTRVEYKILDQNNNVMLSRVWNSTPLVSGDGAEGPRPFALTSSVDASAWPAGPYTIVATAYNNIILTSPVNPEPSTGENDFVITRPVPPAQSFTCSVVQSYASVDAGSGTTYIINTTGYNGFNSAINFTASVTPTAGEEPTISFVGNGANPPGPTSANVSTSVNTPAVPYDIVFTGTSGSLTSTCATDLMVNPAVGDFNLSISPGYSTVSNPNLVMSGDMASFTVVAICTGGFTGPITNLAASSQLSGAGLVLGTTTLACGGSTTLSVSTGGVGSGDLSTPQNIQLKDISVTGQRATPPAAQRTATTNLAVMARPQVSLLVNGARTANVVIGATPNLTWSTSAVNNGNSCRVTNTNNDSSWNGDKNGPGGGSQSVGPMNAVGVFTYSIYCIGYNNIQSLTDTVQINVGGTPSYSCDIVPRVHSVSRGENRTSTIDVTSLNGYDEPVNFTYSISPSAGTPPVISLSGNPQSAPYNSPVIVQIQTFANTTANSYQINFTGTGNISCPPITFTVNSNTPSSEIYCNTNTIGSCEVTSGGSSMIRWEAQNVNECTVTTNTDSKPTRVLWDDGFPKTRSSGPITENTSFYLNCTGVDGAAPEKKVDLIVTANPDPFVNMECSSTEPGPYGKGVCRVPSGSVGYMKWTSQYTSANSCTIDQGIGGVAANNTITGRATNAITGPIRYTITCTGNPGTTPDTDYADFDVEPVVINPPPRMDLKCATTSGGSASDGPCIVASGTRGNLTWTSSNTNTCSIDQGIGGVELNNTGAGRDTNPITANIRYTLSCSGDGGSGTDYVDFQLDDEPPVINPPFVDLKCATTSGGSASDGPCVVVSGTRGNLTWNSTDATTCSISNEIGGVELNNTGAGRDTNPITANITYTLTCSGLGGTRLDSVEFRLEPLPPEASDFFLSCTPASIIRSPGSSDTVRLRTTKTGVFNSRINFTVKTVSPSTANMPSVVIDESTNNLVPPNETLASITTAGNTTPETYVIIFEGSTSKGVKKECRVELQVTEPPVVNPNPPSITIDNLSQCGKVTINWSPVGTPTPTGYVVRRGNNMNPNIGSWSDITGILPGSQRSYTDNSPASSSNYYIVVAYNGSAPSATPKEGEIGNARSCAPNNSKSDKDLTYVSGLIKKDFEFIPCSSISEPADLGLNRIFAVNDKVTFQINVCNTGEGAMTGVYVIDTLNNLKDVTGVTSNCKIDYTPGASPIRFNLRDIPAPAGTKDLEYCNIIFTATVAAPSATSAGVYRFQNIADIYTNELPVKRVFTPPYPFSLTGGVPDRNETAPQ